MSALKAARNAVFLKLRDSMFCVECELISYNNTPRCLACGSQAVLSLQRVLGGSLRNQQTAVPISDEVVNRIVEGTLASSGMESIAKAELYLCSPHATELGPAMRFVVERAFSLTRATGAALALWHNGKMVCHATAGDAAPALGSEVGSTGRGLTSLCVRTCQTWRSDRADNDPRADMQSCRELGVRSVVVSPLPYLQNVLGVLEVLSGETHAFDDHDVSTVQLLASMMVAACKKRTPQNQGKLPAHVAERLRAQVGVSHSFGTLRGMALGNGVA